MLEWARTLERETRGLPFYVSVVDRPLLIPAVNVAILDAGVRTESGLRLKHRAFGLVTEVIKVLHFGATLRGGSHD